MGLYFRKRVKLLPGVWLYLGKKGLSVSGGIGAIRYYQPLTGQNKVKQAKQKLVSTQSIPSEPAKAEYIGFTLLVIGVLWFLISPFVGYIELSIIFIIVGGLCFAFSKRKVKETKQEKIIYVYDEASLKAAVNNLNHFLALMEKDKDRISLMSHYQSIKEQIYQLPPSLELNNMNMEMVKQACDSEYLKLHKELE